MSICTLGPDFDHDGKVDLAKYVKIVFGQWVAGKTAGGCRNDINSFATNPQFLLTLHQVTLSTPSTEAAFVSFDVVLKLGARTLFTSQYLRRGYRRTM